MIPRIAHIESNEETEKIISFINEVIVDRSANIPHPLGYTQLDLGVDSLLFQHCGEGHYYEADYDRKEVNDHHCRTKHGYLIASTPLIMELLIRNEFAPGNRKLNRAFP